MMMETKRRIETKKEDRNEGQRSMGMKGKIKMKKKIGTKGKIKTIKGRNERRRSIRRSKQKRWKRKENRNEKRG